MFFAALAPGVYIAVTPLIMLTAVEKEGWQLNPGHTYDFFRFT